jgi:hypothetical protein
MRPDEIDRMLSESADGSLPPEAGQAAVGMVEKAILADLRPVTPLASGRTFTSSFVGLFMVAAAISGVALGLHGFQALHEWQRASIFPTLLFAGWVAAVACSREMRPAGGARLGGFALLIAVGVISGLVSLVFHGYSTQNLVPEGIPCLVAGLCVAAPTALVTLWISRQGFVLRWREGGLAAGVLSGLAGLGMLELHCPNLKAIHILIWHVGVVVVSAALGFGLGWMADILFRRKAH